MDYREYPDCDGWGEVVIERDTFGPSGHGNRNGRGEVPEDDDSED